jgi:hypothetical protein
VEQAAPILAAVAAVVEILAHWQAVLAVLVLLLLRMRRLFPTR